MLRHLADHAGRRADRRYAITADAAHFEHAIAPVKLANIHHPVESKRRRIGLPPVGAKKIQEIFLTIGEPGRLLERVGLVVAQPGYLRRHPERAELHTGMFLIFLWRDVLAEDLRIVARPGAIPQDTVLKRLLILVKKAQGAALAGKSDRDIGIIRQIRLRCRLFGGDADAIPYLFKALLSPASVRRLGRVFLVTVTKSVTLLIKNHHRASGGPRINANECFSVGRHKSLP